MSKVDLTVFEKIKEEAGSGDSLAKIIYGLANGDLEFDWDLDILSSVEDFTAKYDYEALEGDYGGEGEVEYCYGIFRLQGKIYRATWYYYSYNGCDYDYIESTVEEVVPKEVMKTIYVSA